MKLMHYNDIAFDHARTYQQGDTLLPFTKPAGFWVSVEGEDDWPTWCRSEQYRVDTLEAAHEVHLTDGANILHLTSVNALHEFQAAYGERTKYDVAINWPRVSLNHDGIIIAPYQWPARLSLSWYYGWDCASGCIWNLDAITAVEPVAEVAA